MESIVPKDEGASDVIIDPHAQRNFDAAWNFRQARLESKRHPSSLLSEYVTGIPLEDANLANRLIADKARLRKHYGLPDLSLRVSNPAQYIEILQQIAGANKIGINTTTEYPWKRNNVPLATGNCYDEKTKTIYLKTLQPTSLEHELIHALQDISGANLNIETMEYEAYVCNVNTKKLLDPDEHSDVLGVFWGQIGFVSLAGYYQEEGFVNPWGTKI